MRIVLLAMTLLLTALVVARAEGQHLPDTREEPLPLPLSSYVDARLVADVGGGLTIGGLSVATLGVGLFFLPYGMDSIIAASSILGIGAVSVLTGIPTWIAGAVRAAITAHRFESERLRAANDWEMAGLAVFLISMGIATVGASLMGGAMASRFHSYSDSLALAGGMLVVSGMGLGAFVGSPMWAEATRF